MQLSPSLPDSTLSLLLETLSCYNIKINQVYAFTNNLQLVGSLDLAKSTALPIDQCLRMGEALNITTYNKSNHVIELKDEDGSKLICHTIDGFVFLYKVSE
ncbi:hypothetical protein JA1_004459 [Spathaspora sp. JA1]|nr:hypothetical protein JA1_004459 [Spathaspora sp. JA1]